MPSQPPQPALSSSATPPVRGVEKRLKPRYPLCLRVDARRIRPEERDALCAGEGFSELNDEALALSRPRSGLQKVESRDISASGLRLGMKGIEGVAAGDTLCLDVHLPGDRRVVKMLGDVVWVGKDGGEPVAGLRLAALAHEGLERLSVLLR